MPTDASRLKEALKQLDIVAEEAPAARRAALDDARSSIEDVLDEMDEWPQVRTDGGGSTGGSERFHLCMTCGRLKHERLFEVGDCTCQDCYDDVERGYRNDANVRYREVPDGEGFVLTRQNKSENNLEGAK